MGIVLIALHFSEYALRLAQGLSGRAHVTLILYKDNAQAELGTADAAALRGESLDVHVLVRPRNPWQVLANARALRALIVRSNADVVHVQEALRDEIILAVVLFSRRPTVLTVHDPAPHAGLDAANLRAPRRRLYRWLLRRRADRAIVHGQALDEQLKSVSKRLTGLVDVVPHGPLGIVAGHDQETVTDGSTSAVPAFLLFGRMQRYKGVAQFVRAVRDLNEAGRECRGILAGRGPELDELLPEVSGKPYYAVANRFIAPEELPALFTRCVACVLPYTEGTQSGVAAMAIGYGCPVIATRVGALPELVREGCNGLLVAPDDHEALMNAMRKLMDEPCTVDRLRRGARELAAGEFSWESIATSTLKTYRRAMAEHHAGGDRL